MYSNLDQDLVGRQGSTFMIEFLIFSHVLPIEIASSCILAARMIPGRRIKVVDQFSWSWSYIRKQRHWIVGKLIAKVWINWWKVCHSIVHCCGVTVSVEGSTYMVFIMVPALFSPTRVSMYGRTTNPILWSSMFISEDFIDRSEHTISFSTRTNSLLILLTE